MGFLFWRLTTYASRGFCLLLWVPSEPLAQGGATCLLAGPKQSKLRRRMRCATFSFGGSLYAPCAMLFAFFVYTPCSLPLTPNGISWRWPCQQLHPLKT
jgi:hypothetical protein